jgi:hypothetical protein
MAKCKACQREIFFRKTAENKHMPFDSEPDPDGFWKITDLGCFKVTQNYKDRYPEEDLYQPHWATCSSPETFRTKKQ